MARAGTAFGVLYDAYKRKLESSHGAQRYRWEQFPLFSSFYRYEQGAKKAQDYYNNTGHDDYYGTHWMDGSLNSALGAISAPLPGVRIPSMARSLAKMYGAEVELNIAKYRHATQIARRHANREYYEQSSALNRKWKDYQYLKHDKYWK